MLLAILQALVLSVVVLFSIQDMESLLASSFPVATLFVQATNKAVAAVLMIILAISQFTAVNNLMTAGSQMMWAMARDGCLPGHKFWYKLDGKNETPFRILILLTVICIVVIMPVSLLRTMSNSSS